MDGLPATRPPKRHHSRRAAVALLAIAVAAWACGARLADWLTDSLFRRPSGWLARRFYRDPRPHFASFEEALAALALGPDDRLLEIGCGGGTLLERALQQAGSAKAIDHSPEMVALTSERNAAAIAAGRLEVEQAEAAHLPFADGEFTAAVLTNVFFFLYEPECVLDELHRVLDSGGRLAIHTAAPGVPAWITPIARRMRFYDDAQLVQLLVASGFTDAIVKRSTDGRGQLATARRT
jgi:SAM-dependent methyltransferase